jgi:hypothetical protein
VTIPIVQLPPMPKPSDYRYDPTVTSVLNRRARAAYEQALEVWERVIATFAATHKLEGSEK